MLSPNGQGARCCGMIIPGTAQSEGSVHDGTISQWVRQSLAVFHAQSSGPQILIGSSMGGWIALRMIEELGKTNARERIAGLVLIAPAPDFTIDLIEPNLTEAHRRDLAEKGYFEEGSDYLAEPNRFSQAFLDDGRANRVMSGIIETHCPVHILQGMQDADVPYQHALKLAAHFPKDSITMSLIPDGDHRLSRPQDLAMLEAAIEAMLATDSAVLVIIAVAVDRRRAAEMGVENARAFREEAFPWRGQSCPASTCPHRPGR